MQYHDLPRSRCWLEVNTAALLCNLELAQSLLRPETRLIAVLKADAYGLGIVPVAQLFWNAGIRFFAVACLEEAFLVREALPEAWILCMGETLGGAIDQAIAADIRLTVGSAESAQRISRAACRLNHKANIHIKLDTGLHRIGFCGIDAVEEIACCAGMPQLRMEGLYTHLALHDQKSDEAQHELFEAVSGALESRHVRIPMRHMLDSIGITRYPLWQYSAVRVGALLYGNAPRGFALADQVQPTARFVTRIVRVARVNKGECIGYDDSHPLERDTAVATLAAGYADGYPRSLSFCGHVLIHGQRANNIGLICMDQMMVDVTDIPDVHPGEEAVLLGAGISLTEYAEAGHLNRNECTAVIGKRVPRIYL